MAPHTSASLSRQFTGLELAVVLGSVWRARFRCRLSAKPYSCGVCSGARVAVTTRVRRAAGSQDMTRTVAPFLAASLGRPMEVFERRTSAYICGANGQGSVRGAGSAGIAWQSHPGRCHREPEMSHWSTGLSGRFRPYRARSVHDFCAAQRSGDGSGEDTLSFGGWVHVVCL